MRIRKIDVHYLLYCYSIISKTKIKITSFPAKCKCKKPPKNTLKTVLFFMLLKCKANFLAYKNCIWIVINCCHHNAVN